jgi:hypothetical protein
MTDTNGSVPTVATHSAENGDKNANQLQALETDKEKKERFHSLWIVYFTMFLISLGFSIVLTGIWPYLDKVSFPLPLSLFPLGVTHSSVVCSLIRLPVRSSWLHCRRKSSGPNAVFAFVRLVVEQAQIDPRAFARVDGDILPEQRTLLVARPVKRRCKVLDVHSALLCWRFECQYRRL